MTWGDALENINYLAVLGATLSTVVVGSIWYARGVFGKEWMKLVGLKDKDVENKDGMAVLFASMLVFSFVTALTLSALLYLTNMRSAGEGALMGAIVGFAFSFAQMQGNYSFAKRKFELLLIDGGHNIVQLIIVGWIVGIWV